MRHHHRLAPLLALLAGSCIVPARGREVEGRFQLTAGQRRLEETDDFDAFEHTPTYGVELGFGATEFTGQGREGRVEVVQTVVMRRQIRDVIREVDRWDPDAFVSVEEPRTIRRGWMFSKMR